MADISKITPPGSQTTYNLKDATAREQVAVLEELNGAKNLLDINLTNQAGGNATCTDNGDGSITITPAAGSSAFVVRLADNMGLPAGDYVLSINTPIGANNYITARDSGGGQTAITGATQTSVVLNNKAITQIYIYLENPQSVTLRPMLCSKAAWDAGFTDYQPYSLPNTKITPELIELVDSGAKNLLSLDFASQTVNGVVFTKNNDGTVTVTGTLTAANAPLVIGTVELPAGTYVLSGSPSGGGESSWQIDTTTPSYYQDTGSGVSITLTQTTTVTVRIRIAASGTLNLLFKPMICTKAAWDVSQKFVPYRPTYEETVEQVAENKNNISNAYGGAIIGKNKATKTSGTNTGRYATIPCTLSSGVAYVLSIGQLSSTDTSSSTCQVVLHNTDGTTTTGVQISRGSNVYISISALQKNVDSIYLYPASTGDGSEGKTVTWSNLMCCTAADWAMSTSYQPYIMDNSMLTNSKESFSRSNITDTVANSAVSGTLYGSLSLTGISDAWGALTTYILNADGTRRMQVCITPNSTKKRFYNDSGWPENWTDV